MKERIGSFSKMMGLSTETIRYYEQLGLLHPHRQHENRYRFYDEHDLIQLAQIKQFQGLGFTLGDIAEDTQGVPLHEIVDTLTQKRAQCEREIEQLELRLSRLKGMEEDYRRLSVGLGQARIARIPSMYRLMLSDPMVMEHPDARYMVKKLVSLMPYAHATVIISKSDLLTPQIDPLPIQYGLGILNNYAGIDGFEPKVPMTYYPATRDFSATITTRDFLRITRAELNPLISEMENRGIRAVSDAYGIIRYVQNTSEGCCYYLLMHCSFM